MTDRSKDVTKPFLALSGIGKRFVGTVALDGVDWDVAAGEVHCLIGENGSGKSTLIKLVAGVLAPDPGGRIMIEGVEHDHLTPFGAKKFGIQVIYQDLSLFPNLTVEENIAIDQILDPVSGLVNRKAMRASAQAALAMLDVNLAPDAPVSTLPIAQRQIVAICRGIAAKARLLFMDEPTASLTRHEVDLLLGVVRRLKSLGVSVVFVSHRLDEVVEIADRVTVLRDGTKVGTFPASEIDDHRLAELMTGSRFDHRISSRDVAGRPVVLEVRNVSRMGEFADISFNLHDGEVLGLIGLLGSGRTELALSLFGMAPPDRGEVTLGGVPMTLRSNREAIRAGVAYVSEDRLTLGLNLRQSIADNVSLAGLDQLRTRAGFVPPVRRDDLARSWIERLNIKSPDVEAAAQTLSGGNQQRLVLAKWLTTNPRVLLLDSPTVGVDIRNKRGIYTMIRELAKTGVAILLISDEVPEVYFNCDRVLHMRAGRLVGEFVPGIAQEGDLEEAVNA